MARSTANWNIERNLGIFQLRQAAGNLCNIYNLNYKFGQDLWNQSLNKTFVIVLTEIFTWFSFTLEIARCFEYFKWNCANCSKYFSLVRAGGIDYRVTMRSSLVGVTRSVFFPVKNETTVAILTTFPSYIFLNRNDKMVENKQELF